MEVKIEESWKELLKEEFEKEYFVRLTEFVRNEYRNNVVYPEAKHICQAFELTPVDDVKVVSVGQELSHCPNQAHVLCYSVCE